MQIKWLSRVVSFFSIVALAATAYVFAIYIPENQATLYQLEHLYAMSESVKAAQTLEEIQVLKDHMLYVKEAGIRITFFSSLLLLIGLMTSVMVSNSSFNE